MTRLHLLSLPALAALLAGCSGVGGGTSLTCKLPDGVRCDSVSNTYSESMRGDLPGQRKRGGIDGGASGSPSGASQRGDGMLMHTDPRMTQVNMPLRSAPRIVRVWIKPWEDSDGDLHDQTFVYLPVDEGRWLVEHKQREVRESHAPARTSTRTTTLSPVRPAAPTTSSAAAPEGNGQPTTQLADAFQRAKAAQPAPAPAAKTTTGARNGS